MALAVAGLVEDDAAFQSAAPWDDRHGAGLAQRSAERVRIVALVGQDVARSRGTCEQCGGDGNIGDVSGRQREGEGPADGVGEGMDFGGLAATRGPDRLRPRPPFPPNAERWALM